jgi:hypothetical protein
MKISFSFLFIYLFFGLISYVASLPYHTKIEDKKNAPIVDFHLYKSLCFVILLCFPICFLSSCFLLYCICFQNMTVGEKNNERVEVEYLN